MKMVSENEISKIGELLRDEKRPLKERFRALFTLRNLGGASSIAEISSAFSDSSALLKHELAYCLGQMGDVAAIPILTQILEDTKQEPMVRHEAGEALGAIGCPSVEGLLERYSKDPVVEVAETCQLALARLRWLKSEESKSNNFNSEHFLSVDPSPPSAQSDLEQLGKSLLDETLPLFDRYRAIFSLRNLNTAESAKVLAKGFQSSSALFRHEVGFVLGQMASEGVVRELAEVVRNRAENEMVRHEAAEALGSIATEEAMRVLNQYLSDEARVVKESCQIALDMCEYEHSSEFQYADALSKVNGSSGNL
ncbi:UNVERIFIED_CONTAM: hypothetical protein GTU68_050847 [Idotea baltica]|nr:hypothetical protein [Idotea baltica]